MVEQTKEVNYGNWVAKKIYLPPSLLGNLVFRLILFIFIFLVGTLYFSNTNDLFYLCYRAILSPRRRSSEKDKEFGA
jgi:hypothetical protein